MIRAACPLAVSLLVLLAACASGPTYEELGPTLPPIAAGQGRILLYLTAATEAPSLFPRIDVDGALAAELRPGTFAYVDRPAGRHRIGVRVKQGDAAFGAQGATEPVEVSLAPGEKVYVQADALDLVGIVKVTLRQVAPEDGERDLRPLRLPPSPQ